MLFEFRESPLFCFYAIFHSMRGDGVLSPSPHFLDIL